jgi:hypothetical protein
MMTSGVRQPEKDEAGRRSPVVANIYIPQFLFADRAEAAYVCSLRGVNAAAWKSQYRGGFRNAALQIGEYRIVELIFGPSGEGLATVLYSICSF